MASTNTSPKTAPSNSAGRGTKFLLALCVLMGLSLSGCTTMGNRKLDDVSSYLTLREQKSTKADVHSVFRQPHDVRSTESGNVVWVYYKIHTRPSAWSYVPFVSMVAGGNAREMTFAYFAFDPSATLQRILSKSDTDYENMWAGLGRSLSRISDKTQAQRVRDEMNKAGFPYDEKIAQSVSALRDQY